MSMEEQLQLNPALSKRCSQYAHSGNGNLLKINPRLAWKYLEANLWLGGQVDRGKAMKLIGELAEKYGPLNGGTCRRNVWVLMKFELPNAVLKFFNRLHGRFPKLSEGLVFLANADFLSGILVMVVCEEDTKLTIHDFFRI